MGNTYPCRYFQEVPTQPKVKKTKHNQQTTSLTWYKGGMVDGDSLSWFDFHHPALKYSAINLIWREALRSKPELPKKVKECLQQLLSFLVEVAEGECLSLPFWNNYCYNYLDDTEIFCYSWTSILRKFPRLFITHPAMDTTATTVDPKSVLEPKISCNINTAKKDISKMLKSVTLQFITRFLRTNSSNSGCNFFFNQ